MEEEAGGIQSQAKDHIEPPETRRGKEGVSPRTFGRMYVPADTLSDFCPPG